MNRRVQLNLFTATIILMPNHFSIIEQDYNVYTACISLVF